jgi:type IV secretory pathway VirD2 relaxase
MKWKLSAFREPFKSHKVGEDATELRPDMGSQRPTNGTPSGRSRGTIGSSKRARSEQSAGDSSGRSTGGTGMPTRPPSGGIYGLGRSRKAIVKARYRKHQAVRRGGRQRVLAAHVRYLGRPNATELARSEAFFTARDEACDAAEVPTAWAQDRYHWRIILSPEDSDQLDLRRYIREYVERLERELDTPLEWVAVTHRNTDNAHAHLLIRGRRGDGRDLVIPRALVQDGLREWAEELTTQTLGVRSEAEADVYLNRLATAGRPTELDALLMRLAVTEGNPEQPPREWSDVQVPREWSPELAGRHHLQRRLEALAELGLAQRTTPPFRRAKWRIRTDLVQQLEGVVERDAPLNPVVPLDREPPVAAPNRTTVVTANRPSRQRKTTPNRAPEQALDISD